MGYVIIVSKKFRINVYPGVYTLGYEFNDFSMLESFKAYMTIKTDKKSLRIHENDENNCAVHNVRDPNFCCYMNEKYAQ